jgi:CheY-like chemotaxis protein
MRLSHHDPAARRAVKRVLIVEDDALARQNLAGIFETAGYEVGTASDGQEALDELRRQPADLVILDLVMPGMDGWTFRTHQLLDPALAGIPVAVLSAEVDTLREARLLGIERWFPKPKGGVLTQTPAELLQVLEWCGAMN